MLLGTSLAVFIWYPKYKELGTYNTFCVNEVMAIVPLFFGLAGEAATYNPLFLIVMAIVSAIFCPPFCAWLSGQLSKLTFKRYEAACAGVIAAAPTLGINIIIITLLFKLLLSVGLF